MAALRAQEATEKDRVPENLKDTAQLRVSVQRVPPYQTESIGIPSNVSEAGDTSAPLMSESPEMSDTTPTSNNDNAREVARLMVRESTHSS